MAEIPNTSYNQPSHNHVTVTKVGVNGGDINETKLDITALKKVNVHEYSDSEKGSEKSSEDTTGGDLSDDESLNDDLSSDDDDVSSEDVPQSGTNDDDDNESTTSSVSTTEILGRDPLFLVLSEFLMDEEGNNIVHILSKINKNLSRVAKALEERTSHRHTDRKEKKKH